MKCLRQLGRLLAVLVLHVQVVGGKFEVTYNIHVPVADVMANGRTVFVHVKDTRSWNEASEICRKRFFNQAGSLAKIDSLEAHQVITTLLNNEADSWFGLYYEVIGDKRHFMWSDVRCTDFEFGNLARFKQPGDETGYAQEPCYYLSDKGTMWNNDKCSTARPFVCEYQELNNSSCGEGQGGGGAVAGEAPYKEVKVRFFHHQVPNVSLQACSSACTKMIGCFLTSPSPSHALCLMGVVDESASSLVKVKCVTGIKVSSVDTSYTVNSNNHPSTCVQANTSRLTGNTSSSNYATTTRASECACSSVASTSTVLTTHTQTTTITATTTIISTSPVVQFPSSCLEPHSELSRPVSFHETIQSSMAFTEIVTSFLGTPSSTGLHSSPSPAVLETYTDNVYSSRHTVVIRTFSVSPHSNPDPGIPRTYSTNAHSYLDPVVTRTYSTGGSSSHSLVVPATEAVKATSSPCPGCTCPASQTKGVHTETVTWLMSSFTEMSTVTWLMSSFTEMSTVTVTNCVLTTSQPVTITSFLPPIASLTTTISYHQVTAMGSRITTPQLKPTTHLELRTQQLKPTTHLELRTQQLRPTTHTGGTSRLHTWKTREPSRETLSHSHPHLNNRFSYRSTEAAAGSLTGLPDIDDMRSAIITELLLNDRQLSRSRRTRESSPDRRLSAQISGCLAVLILLAVFSCLLIIDLPRMFTCIKDTFVSLKT